MDLNQVTLPARDIAASIAFYKQLGFELLVESPHYARFMATQGNATFSVHATDGDAVSSAAVVYFECGLLDEQVAKLQAQGIVFTQLPTDQPWLWREARLTDPSGNPLCLYQAGDNRLNPPWRMGGQQTSAFAARTLETERLLIRALQQSDLPALLEMNSDPEVNRFLPYPIWTSMDDAHAWYLRTLKRIADGGTLYRVIVEKATNEPIGTCLVLHYSADDACAEVGYMQRRSSWGKGFVREAVAAVIDDAFGTIGLRRLEAQINPLNVASCRVVESLGFTREGLLRKRWLDQDKVNDCAFYGLLREEWVKPG